MPRLSSVPDAPRRALGLVRVSKEREVMISPEVQRTAIADYAAARGYVITEWREGIDESGSRARSAWWPRLTEAVELVEAGTVDVILVWKYSRTARRRLRWATALDRVETAGGTIESATEQIDASTSTGRFTRGMLAELAAFEAERIGDTWREAHAQRTNRGLPANGKPRFGYVYDLEAKMHRPDPELGPLLASLYRRYVAGEGVYALVQWLNEHGYRTAPAYSAAGPGLWSQTTLRRVLDSGFGAGFITVRGERRPGAHEPVIDEATWEAFRAARAARRTLRRTERSSYLLSGLMRCEHPLPDGSTCGSSMGGGQFGSQRQPKFRCLAAATVRAHQGGYVMMTVAEQAVRDWLAQLAAGGDVDVLEARAATRPVGRQIVRDADAVAREMAALDAQLVTLTLQLTRGVVPETAYTAARAQIEAELAQLADRHARAVLDADAVDRGPLAAQLLEHMTAGALTVAEQRNILRRLLGDGGRVTVRPGRPRADVTVRPGWGSESAQHA